MENSKTLNIVNGQVMYDSFQETAFLKHETMVPFNEAMCFGITSHMIFSPKFIETRSNVHHVSLDQYREITIKPLHPFLNLSFTKLVLWFDYDMFCQINILTILAWLDQIEYKESVTLFLVDEKFKPIEKQMIKPNGFKHVYIQVLLHKKMPKNILPSTMIKGIQLYLRHLNQDSELMMFIQKHQVLLEEELVLLLINNFKDHGFGDTQYIELIRKKRNDVGS